MSNETPRVQLNVRVPAAVREKVWKESDRTPHKKATRDAIVTAIIQEFFTTFTAEERAKIYRQYIEKGA